MRSWAGKVYEWKRCAPDWAKAYEAGADIRDIVNDKTLNPDGWSFGTVTRGLQYAGVAMRPRSVARAPRPRLTNERREVLRAEWQELRASGWTLQQIADRQGCSRQWVSQVIGPDGLWNGARRSDKKKVCPTCFVEVTGALYEHYATPEGFGHHPNYTSFEKHRRVYERYMRGDLQVDISREEGVAYPEIYRAIRRFGQEPNRGGGRYARSAESRAKFEASQRRRKLGLPPKPVKGWRA